MIRHCIICGGNDPLCPACGRSAPGHAEKSVNFHVGKPHADKPLHMNITTPIPEINGAHKVEIDTSGKIINSEIWIKDVGKF